MMRKRIYKVIGIFLVATVAALLVRLFFLEDYRVVSKSMVPNLLAGDLVFVSKIAFNLRLPFSSYEIVRFRSPQRGEVVAFDLPGRGGTTFIKRVVALAGDTVLIKDGVISINGHPAKYKVKDPQPKSEVRHLAQGRVKLVYEDIGAEKIYSVTKFDGLERDYGPIDIPSNHFFVLGDNRSVSQDSRSWGPLPYSCLKGRVFLVWMSLDEVGSIRGNRILTWVE